jgi:hypothetical protein
MSISILKLTPVGSDQGEHSVNTKVKEIETHKSEINKHCPAAMSVFRTAIAMCIWLSSSTT